MNLHPFQHTVDSEEELRALIGTPSELVRNKTISFLDDHCKYFIARSPLLFIATTNHEGSDVSPRGDMPGFVLVLNEQYLIIPERPGNKRIDTMRNILHNPSVGLNFIIPGLGETLRVNGKALLVRDEPILNKMTVNGKQPDIGIGVKVEESFIHCAQAFKRSGLWDPTSWPLKETLPSAAKILSDHAKLPGQSAEEIHRRLEEAYTKRLY